MPRRFLSSVWTGTILYASSMLNFANNDPCPFGQLWWLRLLLWCRKETPYLHLCRHWHFCHVGMGSMISVHFPGFDMTPMRLTWTSGIERVGNGPSILPFATSVAMCSWWSRGGPWHLVGCWLLMSGCGLCNHSQCGNHVGFLLQHILQILYLGEISELLTMRQTEGGITPWFGRLGEIQGSLGRYVSFVSVLKCIYSEMGSNLCTRKHGYYCECTPVHGVITSVLYI